MLSKGGLGRICSSLGVLSLVVGFGATRALAFSNADFSGRWVCEQGSDSDFYTEVYKINPDGAGGFTGTGALSGSAVSIIVFDSTNAAANFCNYTLAGSGSGGASSYSCTTQGLCTLDLHWNAALTNNGSCPPSFAQADVVALRSAQTTALVTSGNVFDEDEAGHGSCAK